MGKIEKIEKYQTVDYSNDEIEYFIQEDNISQLVSYDEIISKIEQSKKKIQIAATSPILHKIIDSLYQINDVNIYIILKSFNDAKTTIDRFNTKKPALLREVESLENNFIIIDDKSYFFINSLDEEKNIFIKFDERYTKDLSFLFSYYFWDCATQEKLENTINTPMESPFPLIGIRELEYVNIQDNDLEKYVNLFIPRDKKFLELLSKNSTNKYFSDDIKTIIYKNEDECKIGNIKFKDEELTITNKWVLKNNNLKNINGNIIPKDEVWDRPIKILDSKEVRIEAIKSTTIESMKDTKPNQFKKELYVKEITFRWTVTPPLKPTDAKKSCLYSAYDGLNSLYQERLNALNVTLNDLEKETGLLNKWFSGANRKAKKNIQKIEEYKNIDLKIYNSIDLKEFLFKEFAEFYGSIMKDNSNFKDNKKKKEAEEKWEAEKESKNKFLEKKETQLKNDEEQFSNLETKTQEKKKLKDKIKEIKESMIDLQKNDKDFDVSKEKEEIELLEKEEKEIQDKQKDQSKLKKSIKNSNNEILGLRKEIEDDYMIFKYNPKENEIKNLNKNDKNRYRHLKPPKYILPEVGILYENDSSYFLQIEDYDELDKANELSQRYKDKENYKVVVGDNNE